MVGSGAATLSGLIYAEITHRPRKACKMLSRECLFPSKRKSESISSGQLDQQFEGKKRVYQIQSQYERLGVETRSSPSNELAPRHLIRRVLDRVPSRHEQQLFGVLIQP